MELINRVGHKKTRVQLNKVPLIPLHKKIVSEIIIESIELYETTLPG